MCIWFVNEMILKYINKLHWKFYRDWNTYCYPCITIRTCYKFFYRIQQLIVLYKKVQQILADLSIVIEWDLYQLLPWNDLYFLYLNFLFKITHSAMCKTCKYDRIGMNPLRIHGLDVSLKIQILFIGKPNFDKIVKFGHVKS